MVVLPKKIMFGFLDMIAVMPIVGLESAPAWQSDTLCLPLQATHPNCALFLHSDCRLDCNKSVHS